MTWHDDAACCGMDPRRFVPAHNPNRPTTTDDHAPQRAVCRRCPVQVECLAEGKATKSMGIWGGVLLRQGREVRLVAPPARRERSA